MPFWSPASEAATTFILGSPFSYGEVYKEAHFNGTRAGEIFWTPEELYNSDDGPYLAVNGDGRVYVLASGLYEINMMVYGYGNGAGTGVQNGAQSSVTYTETVDEVTRNASIGFAYVNLSGVSGELLSPWEKSMAPLRAGNVLQTSADLFWSAGSAPEGMNFQLDVIFKPLMLTGETVEPDVEDD